MPFKSKRQLQTCFGKELSAKAKGKKSGWDCKKWLRETPSPQCLPSVEGRPRKCVKCRPMRKGESIISPIYKGTRGGLYFFAGCVKVYVPHDAKKFVLEK